MLNVHTCVSVFWVFVRACVCVCVCVRACVCRVNSAAGVIIEEGGAWVRYFYLPVAPRWPR